MQKAEPMPEYLPLAQDEHVDAPAGAYWFTGQLSHRDAPEVAENVPAAHGAGLGSPVVLQAYPGSQLVHAVDPVLNWYVPDEHETHADAPPCDWYCPDKHDTQSSEVRWAVGPW